MRVGIVAEGRIDDIILTSLIRKIHEVAGKPYQLYVNDLRDFPLRKKGAGDVKGTTRRLIQFLEGSLQFPVRGRTSYECDIYCVVVDYKKTEVLRKEIRSLIAGTSVPGFVFGVAIQEIEAWILGDIVNTCSSLGLDAEDYSEAGKNPEAEMNPKAILSVLVNASSRSRYFKWNSEDAAEISLYIDPENIARNCLKGFAPFYDELSKKIRIVYEN